MPLVCHRDDDRIGAGGGRLLDQPVAVIRGIVAMRIDADETFEIVAVSRDREVDRRALDSLGVVQAAPRAGLIAAKCLDDLQRSVGAAAVDDDDRACRGDPPAARSCSSSAPMWLASLRHGIDHHAAPGRRRSGSASRLCVGIMRLPPAMGSGGRRPPGPAAARPARGNRRDRRPRCRDPAPRSSAASPAYASAVRPPSSAANASAEGSSSSRPRCRSARKRPVSVSLMAIGTAPKRQPS